MDNTAQIAGIDKALEALADLKTLLQSNDPAQFPGWHVNTEDATCVYYRANQAVTDAGETTAVTLKLNPATADPTARVSAVEVQIFS